MRSDWDDRQLLRLLIGGHFADHVGAHSLGALLDADETELAGLGLPPPLRRRMQVVAEIARRHQPSAKLGEPITDARQALAYFRLLRRRPTEVAAVLLLNARLIPIGLQSIAVGGTSTVSISPRDIFEPAIVRRAASVIVAHNHPGGDPSPSPEDLDLTQNAARAGHALGMELLDHLVVTRRAYFSFREAGMLKPSALPVAS